MSWNLDEQTPDGFEFTLGGNDYFFRYPTTEEIDLFAKTEEDKQLELIYTFITNTKGDGRDISDVLGKANIKVLQRFMEMVKTEFSSGK